MVVGRSVAVPTLVIRKQTGGGDLGKNCRNQWITLFVFPIGRSKVQFFFLHMNPSEEGCASVINEIEETSYLYDRLSDHTVLRLRRK